ncbi:MAG: type III PLP-dependent enzyme [Alphaproteobacteria bacterium]|nr:type III PLP-dependent enzyme [Alphaproteobacteria bacterium]
MKQPTIRARRAHSAQLILVTPGTVQSPDQSPALEHRVSLETFCSAEAMVGIKRPEHPVHCLRTHTIKRAATWFLNHFPGRVMYAVKTNPEPLALAAVYDAGVRDFDVASLAEVRAVAERFPGVRLFFMHPVKSREAIHAAYFEHGIRDFSLDSMDELAKILEVTEHATDLNLYVRLAMNSEGAAYSLAGKFGVSMSDAPALLQATRAVSEKLGLCFHVGSQCMEPQAYSIAMAKASQLVADSGVKVDVLDIGGGFPSIYPGLTPPPLSDYMSAIKQALKKHPAFDTCQILCEPGRALVAEGGSVVVRVEARKGNMLYLNDGTYGTLFDAGVPGFVYPVKAIRPGGTLSSEQAEFGFFGPTCDSMDAMKGPFHLPVDIAEGDWIEIGQLGAYGATMRTNFNGFYSDETVELADKPMMSIFGIN